MLTLDINGKYLVLSLGTSVRVKWKNPACFFDRVASDVAINISLPFHEINRAILGNPEMFQKHSAGADRKFTRATLSFGGAMLVSGSLNVEKATNGYDYWLQSDLGVMGEEQQEKNLQDMAWPSQETFVHKETYDDDTDDYGISLVINSGFWEGKGREETLPMPYTDEDGNLKSRQETRSVLSFKHFENYQFYVNNYNLADIKEGCVISPYLHLRYVIRESLRLNGWYIDRNDMINTVAPWLSIYKNIHYYPTNLQI